MAVPSRNRRPGAASRGAAATDGARRRPGTVRHGYLRLRLGRVGKSHAALSRRRRRHANPRAGGPAGLHWLGDVAAPLAGDGLRPSATVAP